MKDFFKEYGFVVFWFLFLIVMVIGLVMYGIKEIELQEKELQYKYQQNYQNEVEE